MNSKKGRPVSFPDWRAALATARPPLPQPERYATEIGRFLRYCQILNTPVTAPRSREYLSIVPLVSARPVARLAVRWYFAAARAAEPGRGTSRLRRARIGAEKISGREGDVRDAELAPRAEWFAAIEDEPPCPSAAAVNSDRDTP
jgi:hypothetical protein